MNASNFDQKPFLAVITEIRISAELTEFDRNRSNPKPGSISNSVRTVLVQAPTSRLSTTLQRNESSFNGRRLRLFRFDVSANERERSQNSVRGNRGRKQSRVYERHTRNPRDKLAYDISPPPPSRKKKKRFRHSGRTYVYAERRGSRVIDAFASRSRERPKESRGRLKGAAPRVSRGLRASRTLIYGGRDRFFFFFFEPGGRGFENVPARVREDG